YAITQGTLGAGANYDVSFVNGALTIAARPITITADNLSRLYGDANPSFTGHVTGGSLVNGDAITGSGASTATSATVVGTVAITQGTLGASANYAVTFANGQLTITPRPITITADNLSKLFGAVDPALTYHLSNGNLVNGDTLSGTPTRLPGEQV